MCFFNLTNTFFSTLNSNFERNLKEEIFGCFKHIGIPIETVYNMPIQDRRFFILKHNQEQENLKSEHEKSSKSGMSSNADLNAFARNQQSTKKNLRGQ